MVLSDGSADAERRIREMIAWDVNNGIARRAWAGNPAARFAIERAERAEPRMRVTRCHGADEGIVDRAISDGLG